MPLWVCRGTLVGGGAFSLIVFPGVIAEGEIRNPRAGHRAASVKA